MVTRADFVTDQVIGDIVLSFFVDRRVGRTCSGCLSFFCSLLIVVAEGRDLDYLPQLRELMEENITVVLSSL